MTRHRYQKSLDTLRRTVRRMGGLVLERSNDGSLAIETGNVDLAGALRFIVASFKVVADVKRVVDRGGNASARTMHVVERNPERIH